MTPEQRDDLIAKWNGQYHGVRDSGETLEDGGGGSESMTLFGFPVTYSDDVPTGDFRFMSFSEAEERRARDARH